MLLCMTGPLYPMSIESLIEERMHKTSPENRLIQFPEGSRLVRLCRREKRFLVEVEAGGERFWVHCNNSGSMLGLLRPGAAGAHLTGLAAGPPPALHPGTRPAGINLGGSEHADSQPYSSSLLASRTAARGSRLRTISERSQNWPESPGCLAYWPSRDPLGRNQKRYSG